MMMQSPTAQRLAKEFTLFLVATVIGSVVYFGLQLVTNTVSALLLATVVVILICGYSLYRFFSHRLQLIGLTAVMSSIESAALRFISWE